MLECTGQNIDSVIINYSKYITESYKNYRSIDINGNILGFDIASETDEILVRYKNDNSYFIRLIAKNGSSILEKEFSDISIQQADISSDGKVILCDLNSSCFVLNRQGDELCKLKKYEFDYFLSPDGEYIIEYGNHLPTGFYYFLKNGEKKEVLLPSILYSDNNSLRFTPDNKILSLVWTNGYMKERAGDSYIFLYDPEQEKVLWYTLITHSMFQPFDFARRNSAISQDNIILYNLGQEPGFYCFQTKNGNLKWYKSRDSVFSTYDNPNAPHWPQSMSISSDEHWLILEAYSDIILLDLNTYHVHKLLKYEDDISGYNIFDYFNGTLILYQTFLPIFSEAHFDKKLKISSYYYDNNILFYPVHNERIILCDIKTNNIQIMNKIIDKRKD